MNQSTRNNFLLVLARHCLAGLLCCSLFGCTPPSEAGVIAGEKPFFDLKAYFEAEIERLDSAGPSLEKKVTYNGKSETHTSETNDFAKELQLFAKADINRPAWVSKYRIDSLSANSHIDQLTYSALDPDLVIREISIDYQEGEIERIDIYKAQKNFVAKSNQHLSYSPGKGYFIESFQKTLLTKPKDLKIAVEF